MPDLAHFFGEDLQVDATGDLATVDGLDETTQRIIRRLMTAILGYIWHTDYGAGIPQKIGDTIDAPAIQSLVTSQIFKESSVAPNPRPVITVDPFFDGVTVTIAYTSALTGEPKSLSFDVSK